MKSILRSDIVQSILAQIIWVYMLAISKTGRWQVEGLERAREIWKDERGGVLACWHSRILLLPVGWTKYVRHFDSNKPNPAILISLSKDGEFVARASEKLGLKIIRGSSGNKKKKTKKKGGAAAIRETTEFLGQGGIVCITLDGPRGPRQRAGLGAVLMAQKKGARLIPYAHAIKPAKRLNSWDRFLVPFPLFPKGAIIFGEPIETNRDMSAQEIREKLEIAVNEATERAEALIGGQFEPPEPIRATPPSDDMMAAE